MREIKQAAQAAFKETDYDRCEKPSRIVSFTRQVIARPYTTREKSVL